MAIPSVPAEALREAMERFDRELRPTANWVNWEQDRRHRYAIEDDGRRYPVKQIISPHPARRPGPARPNERSPGSQARSDRLRRRPGRRR